MGQNYCWEAKSFSGGQNFPAIYRTLRFIIILTIAPPPCTYTAPDEQSASLSIVFI